MEKCFHLPTMQIRYTSILYNIDCGLCFKEAQLFYNKETNL